MVNELLTLLVLTVFILIIVAFKVMRIRVTPVSVMLAALAGLSIQGVTMIGWKFSAPMTDQMTLHRKITPLLSNQESKEFIKKIHAKHDEPVTKGQPLYEVESAPNQFKFDQLTAQVAVSEQQRLQAEAAVDLAKANVEQAKADQAVKKAELDTVVSVQALDSAAIAKLKMVSAQQAFLASRAAVDQALQSQQESEYGLTTAKNWVDSVQAQLATAKLNLSQNVIRAPADGIVVNWQAVEGTMTTTMIARAQATFMDMSYTVVAAVFPQNLLKNVEPGDAVEIAFKSLPGQIVAGKVDAILEYTGEGQIEPSKQLPVAADLGSEGNLIVRINLDNPEVAKQLPLGADGSVAIYSNVGKPFHLFSKLSVRMKMWKYFLPL